MLGTHVGVRKNATPENSLNTDNRADWCDELAAIRSRYDRRERTTPFWKRGYYRRIQCDREEIYDWIIKRSFSSLEGINVLEVGAGNGNNLPYFNNLGIPWQQIHANELRDDRVCNLHKSFPTELRVLPGNALDVAGKRYDIILASTVFSSILNDDCRQELANHMLSLLSNKGIIIWYDFVYQNLRNPDVRGIREAEVRSLFRNAHSMQFWSVSVMPAIAVLVGPLYNVFRQIPFLRSHLIGKIAR